MLFNPLDYTTVFLSYDEPNCEENYRHLLSLNPQALRVHGVKGSDTAHKEVAKLSKTDSVIVVDGDNFVKCSFYNTTFEVPDSYNPKTNVLSFSAYNTINGNSYGNGGIKVWPVSLLNSMRTHENGSGVDFDLRLYTELDIVASDIHFASDYQAWRAGFREGVKLLLGTTLETMDYRNFDRLWLWTHVGRDHQHGDYAMHGARLAIHLMLTKEFDYNRIIDFDHISDFYKENVENSKNISNKFFTDILSSEDSKTIKLSYIPPYRTTDNLSTPFMAWCFNFRRVVRSNDENEINKLCTIGRDAKFGKYLIDGARQGKLFKDDYTKIFNYQWLQQEYDRLHPNTL